MKTFLLQIPVFLKTLILDSHDVAKILKVQARTIVNWAKENLGPKCKKIGKSYIYTKTIKYEIPFSLFTLKAKTIKG